MRNLIAQGPFGAIIQLQPLPWDCLKQDGLKQDGLEQDGFKVGVPL